MQFLFCRPVSFRIYPVGCHRADSTKITCACFHQRQGVREVGWNLDGYVKRQNLAGSLHQPAKIVHLGPGRICHGRSGLRIKRLDYNLLNMAEGSMQIGDGLQGLDPVLPALADADQYAGGEGDLQPARPGDVIQSQVRSLSRRLCMDRQKGKALQHKSHGGVIGLQTNQILLGQKAGIGVGQ